jgi:hypothetical protein
MMESDSLLLISVLTLGGFYLYKKGYLGSETTGPALTVSYSNSMVTFKAIGFAANTAARVYVKETSGGLKNLVTDAYGELYYSFVDGDPTGTYTLIAEDDAGNTAKTTFKVS